MSLKLRTSLLLYVLSSFATSCKLIMVPSAPSGYLLRNLRKTREESMLELKTAVSILNIKAKILLKIILR